ncbi:phenylalanine--tRNA ligase subunit beta [Salisaeta longa]|uniref:phenylalanine--tRNA ligase subunit beta n=1 Tax=Salisaeta longa TaxID=503170 RepID=UPI0003B36A9C|nr:phenylalanine--tRNA ligase subunit beta [Salisaeta longa]
MDISYRWLSDFVSLDAAPAALADTLTMLGLEVDGQRRLGHAMDGVVVGEILNVRPHPNADRLVLCDVNIGTGAPLQIACGAPNVAAGQKAPVATVGTTLYQTADDGTRTPLTIETRTIRGETSHGMICAEDELELSDNHAGIMVLPDDARVGESFAAYLDAHNVAAEDHIFEIDLTPNRPDAASHLGVARDLAAKTEQSLQMPAVDVPAPGGAAAAQVDVSIDDVEGCPRYVAMVVRDVTVGPSPLWLRRRLTAIGLQPRNTIVDITNYVLHALGQPLHAFDLDALAGPAIHVRAAEAPTDVETLDGATRTVPPGTLMIHDAERPVAVAGVMGGANSEVTDTTTDVLIESAYFDPSRIRRAAKALGLQTDSSYRFERGVDRTGQARAAAWAAQLMASLAGGTVVDGLVDAHPVPPAPATVTLRPERLSERLGTEVPPAAARGILERLGFDVSATAEGLACTVPPWRPDVSIEEDLMEEVARVWGYDRIPEPARVPLPNQTPTRRLREDLRNDIRDALRGHGFRELYTNSMCSVEKAERFNPHSTPAVQTLNPIAQTMAALRPRLLPGVLDVLQFNTNHGQEALRVFEFGRVFRQAGAHEETLVPGYAEHEALLLAWTGPHAPTHWDTKPRPADFYDLKGIAAAVLRELRLDALVSAAPASEPPPTAAYALSYRLDEQEVGTIMRLDEEVARAYDLDAPVFVAEFDWNTLAAHVAHLPERRYEPVQRHPVAERDLAVLVPDDQPAGPLLDAIRTAGQPLLQEVVLFDRFTGAGIPEGQQSLAFRMQLGADRTLTDQEIDERMQAIEGALTGTFDASIRDAA